MTAALFSIVRYTLLQQMRNRLYLVVILFGFLILASSLLFGALAPDQEVRVILNLGLAVIEMFGLIAAIFGAVTLVLEEIESRTIYLILTRPLHRGYFIAGRFLGLAGAVVITMAVMGALHFALLLTKRWTPEWSYLLSFIFMSLKIVVMTAVALFFSLYSSSSVASLVFTLFFWILGHFGSEIKFLLQKTDSAGAAYAVKAILYLTPNFELLNYRDIFHIPGLQPQQLLAAAAYALIYAAACLSLSIAIFSRKEV